MTFGTDDPERGSGPDDVGAVLEEARRLGFLGPGPVVDHLAHARAYRAHVDAAPAGPRLDLGSGGGVPGLVLAAHAVHERWVLLDASRRRTAFLEDAVGRLGLVGRVAVVTARAEEFGRDPDHRGAYGAVVARSFGAPPVVAECAAPLLAPRGRLVVSEPPAADPSRWPPDGLAVLGLVHAAHDAGPPALVVLTRTAPCPARFPRRTGVPAKRPLW